MGLADLGRSIVEPDRFDVGKLKQLEAVEPTLALREPVLLEQLPGPEPELPPDDVVADTRIADDFDLAEMRDGACVRLERDDRLILL